MESEVPYEERVLRALLDLKVEQEIVIKSAVTEANTERFINSVKRCIDKGLGNSDGWEIIFSNNFNRVKKICYICETNKEQ